MLKLLLGSEVTWSANSTPAIVISSSPGTFAHGDVELQALPDLSKTSLCQDYAEFGASRLQRYQQKHMGSVARAFLLGHQWTHKCLIILGGFHPNMGPLQTETTLPWPGYARILDAEACHNLNCCFAHLGFVDDTRTHFFSVERVGIRQGETFLKLFLS